MELQESRSAGLDFATLFQHLEDLGQPDQTDPTFVPITKYQIERGRVLLEMWQRILPNILPNVTCCEDCLSNDLVVCAPGGVCRIEPEHTTISLYSFAEGKFQIDKYTRYGIGPCSTSQGRVAENYLFEQLVAHIESRTKLRSG